MSTNFEATSGPWRLRLVTDAANEKGSPIDPTEVVDAAMEEFGPDDPRLLLDAAAHAPELKVEGTLRAIEEVDRRVGLTDADALKRKQIIDSSAKYLQKTYPVLLSTLYRHVPYVPYDPPRPEPHHYD